MKFGISFTATFFNQGAALVLIYRDGSVQVNHGGAEMGQGLHTKIQQIAAESLGLDLEIVRVMPTSTGKIPNTSATAASAGTDLNGAAVADACSQLRCRLAEVAAVLLGCDVTAVRFSHGSVFPNGEQQRAIPFARVCEAAYRQRIPLFAQGYYSTPDIHYDPQTGRGEPFHYFAYAAAVSEVEVDGFTGDYRLLRTDILEDVGDSVSPLVDRGQIEGGFIQGVGWLTLEELVWDSKGRLATAGASTYKLPSWTEVPEVFEVNFLERAAEAGTIFGSKAVGEPPLMLAISVREAIRDAIARVRRRRASVAREPRHAGARVLRGTAGASRARSSGNFGWCHAVIPAPVGELLRAPLFHTPRNPFRDSNALESYSDGGLLIRDGRVAGCGDYAALRDSHPEVPTVDLRGGFLLPGFIDTHIHFPQLRVLGGLGRSLMDWLEHCALPEEARMVDDSHACRVARGFVHALASHGTTTALVFGAHFAPATAALFEDGRGGGAAHCGRTGALRPAAAS